MRSAIRLYLMQNPESATLYCNDQFSILAKASSKFHLSVLETTLFTSNFSLAVKQLVGNGNVALLVGARTTFEIQPISIYYSSLRICFF